MTGSLIKNK